MSDALDMLEVLLRDDVIVLDDVAVPCVVLSQTDTSKELTEVLIPSYEMLVKEKLILVLIIHQVNVIAKELWFVK